MDYLKSTSKQNTNKQALLLLHNLYFAACIYEAIHNL